MIRSIHITCIPINACIIVEEKPLITMRYLCKNVYNLITIHILGNTDFKCLIIYNDSKLEEAF